MKIEKKLSELAEKVLTQVDELGFQLDAIGVENQINRHNLIAAVMFGQKRLEGEIDSISAKAETGIAKIESVVKQGKSYLQQGASIAMRPASYTFDLVKARL